MTVDGAPKRLGIIMSTEVGLRTQYLNWREHFPDDCGIEPVWIVLDFWKQGGTVERLPLPSGVRGRIRGQIEVAQALRQGPFDAIFVAVHSALALFSGMLDRVPCFMTFDVTPKQLHDFGPIYNKLPSRFAAVERYKHARRRLAYRKCKVLFPWSRWAADSAVADYGAARERIRVLPPGVDLQRFRVGDRHSRPAKPVCDLLFVGGDFERKGGDLLIEWAKSRPENDFRLHIVTRNPVPGAEDERIRVYNGLMPNDPALVDLYGRADVFVLPTRADCYSLAGIEALASGLPVVLGRTGGTEDVVAHGETGYLVEPDNAADLSDCLSRLVASRELRVAMGVAARRDAEVRYDARRNIKDTVALMRPYLFR